MGTKKEHPSWADQVIAITENLKQEGIEIRFNAEPSPELQPKLRAMGFRHSSARTMWYGDDTTQARAFAEEVKSTLPTSIAGPDLFLSPSFQALKSNIEKKEFSFILITLKDGQLKNFIVFESSKPRAEVIAMNFARQQFGDQFLALAVKPKTHIREARILFDEGKIISATDVVPRQKTIHKDQERPEEKMSTTEKIAVKELLLTTQREHSKALYEKGKNFNTWNDADLFVKNLLEKFSDVYYKIIWQDGETVEGTMDLEPLDFYKNKQKIFSAHVQHYFLELSKITPSVLYSKKAIEKAKRIVENYQLSDLPAIAPSVTTKKDEKLDSFALIKNFHAALKDETGFSKIEHASYVHFLNYLNESKTNLTDEEKQQVWNQHLALVKATQKLHNKIHGVPQTQPYSSIYKKLLQVIPDLIKHIEEGKHHGKSVKDPKGGLMDLNFDFLGKDKNGNYLIALSHYFKQGGDMIADPDMQIRVLPELQAAEAMTFQDQFGYRQVYQEKDGKEYVDLKRKNELNRFLNQWLSNIIRQGHRIDLREAEAENEEVDYFHKAYEQLLMFIPGLLEVVDRGEQKGTVRFDDKGVEREIGYTISPKTDNKFCTILLHENVDGEEELQSDITFEVENKQARVTAEWLSFSYGERYDREETQEEIDERDGDIGEEMTRGLTEWLEDILQKNYRIDLSETKKAETSKEDVAPANGIEKTTPQAERFLPNVLFPEGLKTPFLLQNFQLYNMKSVIKNNFPHLLTINDDTLSKASALELFELVQIAHPREYGINVSRSVMLDEWEKRGKELFEELGYPTASNYPYANLYLGYESIESLGDILSDNSKEKNEWWNLAEHYRPIADANKAMEIIEQLIAKEKEELLTLINPKNNKPKAAFKKQARDIELTIENLQDSKIVVQHFIDTPSEVTSTVQANTKKIADPLANEHGVYTEKTAGKNYERIEIPMPKTAQYEASVIIVKTSQEEYKIGLNASKQFGDYDSLMFSPSVDGVFYSTRQEALTYGLKQLELKLEVLLVAKDSILKNEEKKTKNLSAALQALKKFAQENNISLEAPAVITQKKSTAVDSKAPLFIKGLEASYWTKEDEAYPADKVVIKGQEFHQARLRKAIEDQLHTLPIETLKNIAEELSHKFTERRPLATYEKGTLSTGKTGDKHKAALMVMYIDDMIIDTDLMKEKVTAPVMSFLVELLFSPTEKLVDLPEQIERQAPLTMKLKSAYELNKEIEELIEKKDKEGSSFTVSEKFFIKRYTGSGGLLKEGATGRGVLYEYYTPDVVVQKMWGMAYKYGYEGGSVLEPAVGIGNFLKYAPKDAIVFGFETNHFSARIAQILYPNAHIHEKAFESIFFSGNIHLKDDVDVPLYSLVIGNPPYGEFTGKYAGMGEKKWTGATEYDQYFILRGLDLLKKDGLLVFVVPSSFLSYNIKSAKVKEKIAEKADLMDAYRLPIRTFDTTDIGTDILVLRKK